ncbi:RDD family protein [Mycoplasmoides pneumoniae]|uniref:Uncharacterized protein MG243 homolog n=1 Tax=Mycoplasma pneumoniae (strain ATCC 29342 / M129 / Subtype 1) TaxID=272634 RepID=Y339_MYCPN|nr:RDD family protein [Mycoplasmoides pneumoniae]P75439.1 RecName: Full=Uncharacterized protein MG243 homolog [Mycoplasmoides pneumoniae M129]AAB96145.1 conserved hypothetical protein [Mycoplasmoides pneumoniae M129]AGC04258.1 hypothetical protein C985_0345 [Mycoplasmoides pneumoniae M129-B7]ALA30220.1 hypothetical protein C897_01925 [Mycoplasmoides pneumoniae PI 1428]ALA32329.1 hypothetical protein F533_01920 [Mycoplasmoides pneumoniae 51494]ALA33029.1 hypothetical protein F530_01920 [Mycopl
MQVKVIDENSNTTAVLNCAKAKTRALAWLCDTVLLAILLAIIYGISSIFIKEQSSVFLIMTVSQAVLWLTYFVILPGLWKGKTLFRALLGLSLLIFKKRFWNLLVHELFLWVWYSVIFLALAIYFFVNRDDPKILQAFFDNQNSNLSWIFVKILLSVISVLQLVFVVYFCFSSQKQALQDLLSKSFMVQKAIKVKDCKSELKSTNTIKTHSDLPGDIDLEQLGD